MKSKTFILLGLFFALVLVVSAELVAETSKDEEKS